MTQSSETYPPVKSPESEANMWAMFLHLSVFAGYVVPMVGLVAPILIWQLKKNEMPILDAHGKNQANWMISMLIYGVAAMLLTLISFGLLALILYPALLLVAVALPIIAAIKANNGEVWPYPLSIRIFS